MVDIQPVTDDVPGFAEARRLMACYEARQRTRGRLAETDFIDDKTVTAVHVDNISRADRSFLTAFNQEGREVSAFTLYNDEPDQHLDFTPEFDHDLTRLTIPGGSELDALATAENGWIVDMTTLRRYDAVADRRATQRAVVLAHLVDMLGTGDARGFLLETFLSPDGEDGPDESDAA